MQYFPLEMKKVELSFGQLFSIAAPLCIAWVLGSDVCVKGLIVNERGRSHDPWHTPTRTRTMRSLGPILVSFRACLSATPS